MRGRRLFVAGIAALPLMLSAAPVSAVGNCPDGHMGYLVVDERSEKQDHNNNGVVCRRIDGQGNVISGGPDDYTDDIF